MVNVNCTGGGGIFSDDVTASKAQVVEGYSTITSDSHDEIITGTMKEVSATEQAKQIDVVNSNLVLRMTNGAHRTDGTTGYPEVYIPLSTLRTTIGYTDASKVLTGTTIAGLAGTMVNRGAWSGTIGLSGAVTIPQGYHNGSGKITRAYTVHSGGTFTPQASDQTIATSNKIITGDIKCSADTNLTANNIANGVQIFGITGNMMKYTAGSDSTIFTNGVWSNQMRYAMTSVCWCRYSGQVSGGSYSYDNSSYLGTPSTNAPGYHIDTYATYSAGTTLNCNTRWASWQGNDDDEYGFGVVYIRANQTFNPAIYSGVKIVRDFYGSGRQDNGQTMTLYLYDTSGNLVASGSNTLYPTSTYSQWYTSDAQYTFTFPSNVFNYSQLRLVLKFRNTATSASNYTSAIKSITLLKK